MVPDIEEIESIDSETQTNIGVTQIPPAPQVPDGGEENANNVMPPRFDIAKSLSGVFNGITIGEDSKLHFHARRGDHERVRQLLSGRLIKRKPSLINMERYPSFQYVYEIFDDEVSKEGLEQAKKMLNSRNRLGATPLWLAAASGNTKTVEVLCEFGANTEIPDIKGQTPLFSASKYNNVDCVRALLKAGANPEGNPGSISTPIYIASRENLPDVVRLLIKYGADVNGRYGNMDGTGTNSPFVGSVPLYMTIVYQNFECFRLLILNGAELHASSNERGFGTSLVTGVLRHQCDVSYLKLIALCGGIRHGDKKGIDEAIGVFRNFTHGLASTRKECLEFLDYWNAQPMKLVQLCRITIRRQMGQKRLKHFKDLKLPRQVHRYVLFSEHMT